MDPVDQVASIEQAVWARAEVIQARLEADLDATQAELEKSLARQADFEAKLEQAANAHSATRDSLTQTEAELKAATERNAEHEQTNADHERLNEEHEQRLMRAEKRLKEIEEATWLEFLILLGIGAVFTVAGVMLQRRFNWKIPWVLIVGTGCTAYALTNKKLPKGVRFIMVGGGAGLATGAIAFTVVNAFPGWHKSS